MRILLLLITGFLISSCTTMAQNIERNHTTSVTINSVGKATAPADRIRFRVHLVQFNEDARTAFSRHKELEEFLTGLIKEEGISSEHIVTEPISIGPAQRGPRGEERGFETRQSVTLVLDDIYRFENMQLLLIENGFDNFSAQFGSSRMAEAGEEALAKAVESARKEAGILAGAAGRILGKVISIQHGSSPLQPFARSSSMDISAEFSMSGGSLLEFEQHLPVEKNVTVVFEFVQN